MSHTEAIVTGSFSAVTVVGDCDEFPAWMEADGKMVAG